MRVRWSVGSLTASQRELVRWQAPPEVQAATTGALSLAFGTGKTTAAALRFARVCMSRPRWSPDRERQRPLALVLAPTYTLIRMNLRPLLEWAFPREVVVRKTAGPPAVWTLANGVEVWFMSGDAIVDSGTAFAMLIDEVSYPCFLDQLNWSKLVGRLRAPGYTELVVSGIASSNPIIRERFDAPEDPGTKVLLPGLDDAPIEEAKKARILASLPLESREAALRGGWGPDRTQVYVLDREHHRTDAPVDKSRGCYVALDPGRSSAAIVCQLIDGVLVVVDELVGYDESSRSVCMELKQRGWVPEQVALDTQAHVDSAEAVQSIFPTAWIRQAKKRSAEWEVEKGHEHVRTCLRDATGRTRLKFHGTLWDEGHPTRGVVRSMLEYRYKSPGRAVRDDRVDHQCDVVRYAAIAWLQTEERPRYEGPRVVRMR